MTMLDLEILRAAVCVAGLDGHVCDREHPLLTRLADRAGVGSVSLAAMIDLAEVDRQYYEEQFDIVKTDPEKTIKILMEVAVADGVLSVEERVIVSHFATKLGMSEQRFGELLAAAEAQLGKGGAKPD